MLVTFDNTSDQFNAGLNYIKTLGMWARLSSNSWLLKANLSAVQLRDLMNTNVPNLRVTIFDVTSDFWATTYVDEVSDWMKSNV